MPPIDSELIRLLMRTGYMAAWKGFHKEAVTIFNGVAAMRPNSEAPLVGAAVVAMLASNYEVAHKALEQALEMNPDSAMTRAHLGIIQRLNNLEDEGMETLKSVAAQTEDSDAAALASNVLELEPAQLKPAFTS